MVAGRRGDVARGAQLAGRDADRHGWALASGEDGRPDAAATYVLVANTAAWDATCG